MPTVFFNCDIIVFCQMKTFRTLLLSCTQQSGSCDQVCCHRFWVRWFDTWIRPSIPISLMGFAISTATLLLLSLSYAFISTISSPSCLFIVIWVGKKLLGMNFGFILYSDCCIKWQTFDVLVLVFPFRPFYKWGQYCFYQVFLKRFFF